MPVVVGLDATLRDIDGIEGWLHDDQALRLWARASSLAPPARIVEIGSFHGRSTIVLARAAAGGVEIVAIDPHAGNDRGPQEIDGYRAAAAADRVAFDRNLRRAGVADRVRHVSKPSHDAHGDVSGEIDLLYVDGAHRYRPARDDLLGWGRRLRPGGTMLIHDSFSAVGVTLAIGRTLLASREFAYAGRTGSLAEYRRVRPDTGRNALRQLAELPWFARNISLKALIAAGVLRREWPY